jgi:hypothetical protein
VFPFHYPAIKKAGPEHACLNYQRTDRKDSKGTFDSQGKFAKNAETAGLEHPRNPVKLTPEAARPMTKSHLFRSRNPSLTARLWYFHAPYSHEIPPLFLHRWQDIFFPTPYLRRKMSPISQ